MTRDEAIQIILENEETNDNGFDPEVIGETLSCSWSDKEYWLENMDFSLISDKKLQILAEYIIAGRNMAMKLDELVEIEGIEMEGIEENENL